MKLSEEEVLHLAQLVRMGISDEEVEYLRGQLSDILDNFQILEDVDTSNVPPTGHAIDVDTVMREDEPGDCLPVEEVLGNAPRREDDLFRVKAVLE